MKDAVWDGCFSPMESVDIMCRTSAICAAGEPSMKPEITARLRLASSSKMMPSGRGSVVEMIALGCRSSLQQRNGTLGS